MRTLKKLQQGIEIFARFNNVIAIHIVIKLLTIEDCCEYVISVRGIVYNNT